MLKGLKEILTSPQFVGKCLNTLVYIAPGLAGAISFRLFCSPQKGRTYTSKETRFLEGAKQERISLRNFEIQTYMWQGEGPKVLLAHGWDSNVARWRGLVPMLQKANLSILALDAPGHGKSGSKLSNGVLYAEAIEKVVQKYKPDYVVGHSFGGMAAAYYFSEFDHVPIQKLILMGTPSRLRTIMHNFNRILGLSPKVQAATDNYFIKNIGFGIDYFSVESYIQQTKISGLVLHDEKDEVAPIAEAKAIHQNWKGSSFHQTSGLGHSMQAGSVFRRIVEEF